MDDELLAEEKDYTVWLVEELEKIFKVEKEGPYPLNRVGNGAELRYLKLEYVFLKEGVVVQPNEQYVKKLLELYDLGRLKSKATPEHVDLVKEDKSKELGPEETKRFRSGLGSVLYLAQDRIDIQYASKCLAITEVPETPDTVFIRDRKPVDTFVAIQHSGETTYHKIEWQGG